MARIAFLGLGAMGARMAARLISAGHELTVWNRTPERVQPLVELGARSVATPALAAAGQEVVIAMVRDDEASHAVWLGAEGALAAMAPGAIGVECSTLSLPGVQVLVAAFAAAGRSFVDAPLAGSRPQAEAGALIFLAGGEGEALDTLSPILLAMGGAVHHAGPVGAGCMAKLLVNAMFGAQIALMGEMIGLIRATGFDPAPVIDAYAATPVASPALKLSAPVMLGDQFPPAFPIDLVAKDFAMLAATADSAGAATPLSTRARQVYAAARDAGLGDLNITGIVRGYAA